MKKLLFMLLFIPLISFGQETKEENSKPVYKITISSGEVIDAVKYRTLDKQKVIDILTLEGKLIRLEQSNILSIRAITSKNILDELIKVKDTILNLKFKEKSITAIIDVKNKSKSEIYSSINKWVSLNYGSANNVIQMNDKESGIMIVKGSNSMSYLNPSRAIWPKIKFYPVESSITLTHVLEINVRDDKFRIKFTLNDVIESMPMSSMNLNPRTFDCINFTGASEESISKFNSYWKSFFKGKGMGKKRKEKYYSLTEPTFTEINTGLVISLISNIQSIYNSVNIESDDW
jgi:hypothetical protein